MKTRMLVFSLVAVVIACSYWLFKSKHSNVSNPVPIVNSNIKLPDYSGIQVIEVFTKDIRAGKGAAVTVDSKVTLSYEGWIYDPASLGNKGPLVFSKDKFKSVTFKLKDDSVLQGFKKGLLGMKTGGLRQLIVPASLAYGDKGLDTTIPPKAILLFEIELLNAN